MYTRKIFFYSRIIFTIISILLFAKANSKEMPKDSSNKFFNRISCGIYCMTDYVTVGENAFREHVKGGGKILGWGINSGVNAEYDFSERRAIRLGVLYSQNMGTPQIAEDPSMPFMSNPPSGFYYYSSVNESHIELPITFQYRFLKKKYKISPYLLAGLALTYTYKVEYIYTNATGYIPNTSIYDHTEIHREWESGFHKIIITVGFNYIFSKKLFIYLEPLYLKRGSYLGYGRNTGNIRAFNDWGIGLGVNYCF